MSNNKLNSLLPDVLIEIFSFIPKDYRKHWLFRKARFICSEWNDKILATCNILVQVPPSNTRSVTNLFDRYQHMINAFREREYFHNISSLKFGTCFNIQSLYQCTHPKSSQNNSSTMINNSDILDSPTFMKFIDPFENFSNLQHLCLHHVGVSSNELNMMCNHSKNLRTLKGLTLSHNSLTCKEVQFIVNCHYFRLTSLNLAKNNIDNEGCLAIVIGKNMENLAHLDLSSNPIRDINIFENRECKIKRLRHLNLSQCQLDNNAKAFSNSENMRNLICQSKMFLLNHKKSSQHVVFQSS